MIGQRQTPLGSIPGGWSELNLAKFDNPDSDSTSAKGTLLPRAKAVSCPQLAEGDIGALADRSGFDVVDGARSQQRGAIG